jgi:hypothetical protein
MKSFRIIQGAAVALACMGMFVGQLARAAQPLVTDVALARGGVLAGKIVDRQGAPQAGQTIRVIHQGQVIGTAQTDTRGEFAIADLRGGVYQVETEQGAGVYRLWADQTAPPAANDGVLVVHGDDAVRGNACNPCGSGGGGLLGVLANPWVLAAIVAAAIAIPLALDDDDDAS